MQTYKIIVLFFAAMYLITYLQCEDFTSRKGVNYALYVLFLTMIIPLQLALNISKWIKDLLFGGSN